MIRVPGEHAPNIKNRSSKQYFCLTKHKPLVRSMNNEQLRTMAGNGDKEASKELSRRAKNNKK